MIVMFSAILKFVFKILIQVSPVKIKYYVTVVRDNYLGFLQKVNWAASKKAESTLYLPT